MAPLAHLEPMLPDAEALRPRAGDVVAEARDLGRHLHPATLRAVAELLRTINCYYSNLIEGHNTHPVDIERALAADYSADPARRNLQIEARAHIEVQRAIEARLDAEPGTNVCDETFVRWIHEEFYRRLPHELRVVRHPTEPREAEVLPGALRTFDVQVGRHVAPPWHELNALLARFAEVYDPRRFARNGAATGREVFDEPRALVALAAAHHRLLWIHPFGDGNGRVGRLMTDAYIRRIGLGGHGLWTVSRGLARQRDRYREALAAADAERGNDFDGRGARSAQALHAFCEFFLDVCAHQVRYMSGVLAIDALLDRVAAYGRAREAGAIPSPGVAAPPPGRPPRGRPPARFRPAATRLLRALVAQGPVARAETPAITGLPGRSARRVLQQLTMEGFVIAASHRAPLELRFPAHAAPYLFPGLYSPTPAPSAP
jgi:Fic family protein